MLMQMFIFREDGTEEYYRRDHPLPLNTEVPVQTKIKPIKDYDRIIYTDDNKPDAHPIYHVNLDIRGIWKHTENNMFWNDVEIIRSKLKNAYSANR